MRVLGISPLDKDATASFMEDGQVVFACAEERLSRVKLQDGFPHRAIKEGLVRTGWDPASIDAVAYAFFAGPTEAQLIREAMALDFLAHSSTSTKESIERYRAVTSNGYHLNRSVLIPGLDTPESEFIKPKSWYKRWAYNLIARSPRLDNWMHRRCFARWAIEAIEDHMLRSRQL
jgi:carbamoyltransferase